MSFFKISKLKSLVDELIHIQLNVAKKDCSKVTLRSYTDDKATRFSALSYYLLDQKSGILNLSRARSIGGSYLGVEPMGFIWAMRPESGSREGSRLLRRDARLPIKVELEAYDGHLRQDELSPNSLLCSASLERTYLADNVRRIPVKHGRIRGTLFIPKGYKSCPGVIDLFGMGGGLMEFRGALLASKGFVTLSLAFFNFDDLPQKFKELDMTYFEEAVDFILEQKEVSGDKIGVVGVSKGAEIACLMSCLFPDKIEACVVINGMCYLNSHSVDYKGEHFPNYDLTLDGVEVTPNGLSFRDSVSKHDIDVVFPVERANGNFLLVSSLDDFSVPLNTVDMLAERLSRAGKNNFKILRYPGAGHLFEPPYSPLCNSAFISYYNILVNYGGFPYEHNLAQIHFWSELQIFLKNKLGEGEPA